MFDGGFKVETADEIPTTRSAMIAARIFEWQNAPTNAARGKADAVRSICPELRRIRRSA
jgi:hypothetical protein